MPEKTRVRNGNPRYKCFGTVKYGCLARCEECPDKDGCKEIVDRRCNSMMERFKRLEKAIEDMDLRCAKCGTKVMAQANNIYCRCGGMTLAHKWFIGLDDDAQSPTIKDKGGEL